VGLIRELQRTGLLELFGIAFDHMEEGILMADNSGIVVFYNQAAASLEGLQPSQVIGRHIDELYLSDSTVS
jgi:arginine utilization regulatory protein